MSVNDPIADMLTRIRNAVATKASTVVISKTKICLGIAEVLKGEGYINDYVTVEDGRQGLIRINLKYGPRGEQIIHQLTRISKPGCRVYRGVENLPRPMAGLGISIVSTSRGIFSDRKAKEERVGGELLCSVE
ncbi:MAG: 30S ribosomal protein S8 [Phycisphaeraceae bacterium]|jgi:small subunit ribosomal protein S8